ncbi:hypothetical protein AVEN_197326-1 [Araneus ventricosus]|uniref:Uncharacterized protein n=1 Tax=Araneus ventricosus TaxID=182803 RepID=A0A4Y2EYI8_ARAVE|nr:hypothetical protein AVEN_197326-1 [Araneus ventricosus]
MVHFFPVSFLQSEWQKLQECYRIILFSRSKSKDSSSSQKLWKFEEQMKFMEYYLQPKKTSPRTTDSLTEQRIVVQTLEPELMEISSSAIASKTTEPEREINSSALGQSSEIPSQGCSATSIGMKVTVGDKAPFPGHQLKNTIRFCNLPDNYDTVRMETVPQAGRAPPPDVIPETSGTEKVPLPEIRTEETSETEKVPLPEIRTETIETEVMIVYDGCQQGNRIPERENIGFHTESEVFSRIEEVPLPEIKTETIETEVMIVYEGNPLDNRIPGRENVGFNGDYFSDGRSSILLPSTPQVECEVSRKYNDV